MKSFVSFKNIFSKSSGVPIISLKINKMIRAGSGVPVKIKRD